MQAIDKTGLAETIDNQRIVKLVEEALRHPATERRQFLQRQCGNNTVDFEQALHYVDWEQRMQDFLLEPAADPVDTELALAPGDMLLDRFRIVRQIAQGGMGVVYEAHDEKLDRRIALKCAKAGFAKDLPPEVRHATEISHPNVCKLYEIHSTFVNRQLLEFITMEFLEGETLAARLRHGRIPVNEAKIIARQLAAGVDAAHQNGVIHGDIKSNNVILARSAGATVRAVITDFGLARTQGATSSRGVWGTPGYMAPELWLGEPPTVASDLYALGILFYEMATGRLPDRSQTSQALSQTLKATPWLEVARKKPPTAGAYWDRILSQCLDPDPKKRYRSTGGLVRALAPGHARRNALLSAVACLALALTGFLTYRGATAPTETVKLAVTEEDGNRLLPAASTAIAQLTGSGKVGFALLAAEKIEQATHVLKIGTSKQGDRIALHAVLTDAQSQSPVRVWDGLYTPGQIKYAPQALAGVVSAGLHLTPQSPVVNRPALPLYRSGLQALRQNAAAGKAWQDLELAATLDPDSPLVWAALAEAASAQYSASKDSQWLAKAREAERQSELRDLDTPIGHRAAADLDTQAHRYEGAESHLLRAVELEASNSDNYRQLGFVYWRDNQFDKALRALRKAVGIEPGYYLNQLRLGQFYLDQGRYKEAVQHLGRTVQLAPSLPFARFNLAAAYTDTGQFDKALENLNSLKQWSANEHFQMATILMYEKRDAEAIPHLLFAVKQNPDVAFWMQLEIAQRHVGQLAAANQSLRNGLRLVEHQLIGNPNDGNVRAFLGYFCARLSQRDRAESETAQALRLGPHQLDVIWAAVETYEVLGKREEALAILRASAPPEMLDDLKRWPEMSQLTADSRFTELTALNADKKEKQP